MAAAPPRVVLSRRKKDGLSGTDGLVRVEAAALAVVESTGVGSDDENGDDVVGASVGGVVGTTVVGGGPCCTWTTSGGASSFTFDGVMLGSMEGESVVGDLVGGGSGSSTKRDVNEGPVLGMVDGK